MKVRDFFQLISQHRPKMWIIVAAAALGVGETLLALAIPMATMNLVEEVAASSLQAATIVVIAAVFALQTTMSAFSVYSMSYVGQYIIRGLRSEVWGRIMRLPVAFFDRNHSGETMSRVTNDTNVIKDFIVGHVISFLGGIISILGGISILLWMDWRMTLLMLLAVPAALLILWPLGSRMFKISKKMQDETAMFQGDLGRVLTDIRLVKASVAEQTEQRQGKVRIQSLFKFGLQEAKIMSIVSPMMMTVMLIILVLLIGYGGVRVAQGDLSTGQLVAIILYMFQIVMPFTQMASFFTQFQKAMGASERLMELMAEPCEGIEKTLEKQEEKAASASKDYALNSKDISGRKPIVFQNVQFQYSEERAILQDVSFQAEAGQLTAIVGPSGAGKTTLFSLIERYYTPSSGEIYYGEHAVEQLPLDQWRKGIAYVSQESPIMAGSISHNLMYGLEPGQVDEQRMKEVLQQANLQQFIESLPKGLETEVGERGVMLSGGQRQRLAIARAMLREPHILLMDEATAHLDSESEKLVQEALNRLMKDRTTIVIAHRLSTIVNANKIIVVEQGTVTGQGTHAELLQTHKLYTKLAEQQFISDKAS
ncbi:ABC transporter ATP-binding protein [Paenibacillus sp. IITD108]|uniref:ABC transporter ATP-binding protein n=1 Tax=Paenibacillus sp. IITD108 TaxID=3116649 RepID=UPI002F3FB61A